MVGICLVTHDFHILFIGSPATFVAMILMGISTDKKQARREQVKRRTNEKRVNRAGHHVSLNVAHTGPSATSGWKLRVAFISKRQLFRT
jgi:hypothetical protein